MQSILSESEKGMKSSVDHLKEELKNIRTGRASPSLLDSVMVDVYGTAMRLRDLATVTAPEPRQLMVTPFDRNNCGPVSKGIERSNLGLQPTIDGNIVRINIPPMDEAKRKEMVKLAWDKCEKCKVSIRDARRKANESLKQLKSDGELTEDALKGAEKKIQDQTDRYCKLADETVAHKEEEVLAI